MEEEEKRELIAGYFRDLAEDCKELHCSGCVLNRLCATMGGDVPMTIVELIEQPTEVQHGKE